MQAAIIFFAALLSIVNAQGGGGDPPDLGDLIVLYRDEIGVPITTPDSCRQPLAASCDDCTAVQCQEVITSYGTFCVLAVNPSDCSVIAPELTQEVDFGRISGASRSPAFVREQQLEEAVRAITIAGCVNLDPAGRIIAASLVDGVVVANTIDSPLQNFAMYEQLTRYGKLSLGAIGDDLLPDGVDWETQSARFLAAAYDKDGTITIDVVQYTAQIIGLTDPATDTALGAPICIDIKEEVLGVPTLVERCFLNYGGFLYDRADDIGVDLPDPAYVPVDQPLQGWFEYLAEGENLTFFIDEGPILDAVGDPVYSGLGLNYFEPLVDPATESGIGFTQAADDARAVIKYMHDWTVPFIYETPSPCLEEINPVFDIFIDQISGLQVPTRIVPGVEREVRVIVQNSGPATASGQLSLTGVSALGAVTLTDINGNVVFNPSEPFTLIAGGSQEFLAFFSLAVATSNDQIAWTAFAQPDQPEGDITLTNNLATGTTLVQGGGGGQGVNMYRWV